MRGRMGNFIYVYIKLCLYIKENGLNSPRAQGRSLQVIPGLQSNPFPIKPRGQLPHRGPFGPRVHSTPAKQGFGEQGSLSVPFTQVY